jgi:hypothetical protein
MRKPILCLDFDGVLHSYTSGWTLIDQIKDPPVPGAMDFLLSASQHFQIHVFSSRSKDPRGLNAMNTWLEGHIKSRFGGIPGWFDDIRWPTDKPAAHITLDDRALTFTGKWPHPQQLLNFKPWNR